VDFNLYGSDFSWTLPDGQALQLLPNYMMIEENRASFVFPPLPGSTQQSVITFAVSVDEAGPQLQISAGALNGTNLATILSGIEMPFSLHENVQSEGMPYHFDWSPIDEERQVLLLDAGDALAVYRTGRADESHDETAFVLQAAWDETRYHEVLNRWRNESWTRWSASISSSTDETLINAFLAESQPRGSYEAALLSISRNFLNAAVGAEGSPRSYRSSVYFGSLVRARSGLLDAEDAQYEHISSLIEDGSGAIFLESHVIEFLALRGYGTLIDRLVEIAAGLDAVSPDMIPGLLECCYEWNKYRSASENPFQALVAAPLEDLPSFLYRDSTADLVLFMFDERSDTAYNIRLGLALNQYQTLSDGEWGAVGRSLVLSALSLAAEDGSLPAEMHLDETAAVPLFENPEAGRLSLQLLYNMLVPDAPPRMSSISGAEENILIFNAASKMVATFDAETHSLDISAAFPVGQSQYMIILGLPRVNRVQFGGQDWRTDPNFERYDSSGWAYSSQFQAMLIKMRHRSETENLKIYF
jgi:hypothetical protein